MPENNELVPQENVQELVENVIPELNDGINNETEPVELTEEEKRAQFIEALKESKKNYKPKKHFGIAYKKDRKRKNKISKASRKANRR
jgi:hypothetical protein